MGAGKPCQPPSTVSVEPPWEHAQNKQKNKEELEGMGVSKALAGCHANVVNKGNRAPCLL